jgi:hypothetical protein
MDFQRLFKRKEEGPAPQIFRDKIRETLNERDVLVCEGELLDGKSPASLVWSNVGGRIRIKADKILGILEGRTRIKAAVLQELYPGLFEKAPNPGTEFNIPLQTIVMQLEEIFTGIPAEDSALEDFDTPFGQLARQDEARFKDQQADRSEMRPMAARTLFMLPQLGAKPVLHEQDQKASMGKLTENGSPKEVVEESASRRGNSGPVELQSKEEKSAPSESSAIRESFERENGESGNSDGSGGIPQDNENIPSSAGEPEPAIGKKFSAPASHSGASGVFALSSDARMVQNANLRREGHAQLQELYLTDEPLDGSTVADLILQLPRVAGVVVMLSNGAALGGGLRGGVSEALLSLTPDFVKHLLSFTKSMPGGPANFVLFSSQGCKLSLTIGGDVLILAGHEGKELPPGVRERLVSTAQALNMIYGSRS